MANLFDQPGKPFGYAFIEERTRIEDHVRRRTLYQLPLYSLELQSRVRRIQDRLHKYDKTFAERSRAWAEQQAARSALERRAADFKPEELSHLVEMLAGANHPLSASIADKAQAKLELIQTEAQT